MNKKDIKILVASHKKYKMPNDSIYLPLHVGREGKEDLGYQGDNTGENISFKNESYCELTGLYWAWKNLDCDQIGLCHYRRYFTNRIQRYISKNKKYQIILDEQSTITLLSKYEVILPKKRNYFIETIWSHYEHAHNIKDLEKTRNIIKLKYPEYITSFDKVMRGRKLHLFNMFIMNKKKFNEYCSWLFDILFELENEIDISYYDNYQKRVFGFIAERLFNVWLEKNKLNCIELDVLNIEHINSFKKFILFIKRKFITNK